MNKKYEFVLDKCKYGTNGYFVVRFLTGRFKNEEVKIEKLEFGDMTPDGEHSNLFFDYTLLSGKKIKDTTRKLLEEKVAQVVLDVLELSVDKAREMLNDSV